MKLRLLEYLICPKCKGKFEAQIKQKEEVEIMEGQLRCGGCGTVFAISRGVPRLLSGELSKEKAATAKAFGYEWTHFTELTDQYRHQFLDWIKPIPADFFHDKVVLDAGCGKGRHVWLAAQFGAREIIGLDLSEAVDVAFEHARKLPNVHIVQADIYQAPFATPFDFIYSIGVLHHLPDPRQGFLALLRHLKPGGTIAAWVYGREGNEWIVRFANPIRNLVTSRLPKPITKFFAFVIAIVLQPLLRLVYRPVNQQPRLQRFKKFLFYNDYLYSISSFSFRENYSIIFDHMIAPTAFYISRPEFEGWFTDAGLSEVVISQRNSNSWRGKGTKIKSFMPSADHP